MRAIEDHSLYLVVTEEHTNGRSALEIVRRAVGAGVDIVQMREKNRSMRDLVKMGAEMAAVCAAAGRLFIVNDDPMLAMRVNADGVHLGQEDVQRFPISMARDTLGPDRIIGISTHSLDQFKRAEEEDVDYIAFGPIFTTKTKNYSIGTADIGAVMSLAKRPVFFIGGITLSNIDEVHSRGARNIALIRAITESDDIEGSVRSFKERLARRRDAATV